MKPIVWRFVLIFIVCFFIIRVAKAEPAMSCSKAHINGVVRCFASDTNGLDVEWFNIAYGKIEYSDFGVQVALPIHAKYYTLIVMNLTDSNNEAKAQSGIWARALSDRSVDYKKFVKGIDPNKDIPEPRHFQKACVVSILGAEGRVFYDIVLIVGENPDDYWVIKEGYDKPVNVPKEKVLLQGQTRIMKALDGQQRKCTCLVG